MITTFKTQISLKAGINQDDVWETIKAWRLNSRNTSTKIKSELENHNEAPEHLTFSDRYSTIQSKSLNAEEKNYWGFNLTEKEPNSDRIWNTYIILTMDNGQNILTFETVVNGAIEKIKYNKPKYFGAFITPLIDSAASNIASNAINIDKASPARKYLIDVLNGVISPTIPLIYISVTENGKYLIDPEKLAIKLYCVAIVFKEPNIRFSYYLKRKTNSRNVYKGAIGIYWGQQKRFYFLPEDDTSIEKVYSKIIEITTLQSFFQGASWFDLQQIETAQKQEKLKREYQNLKNNTTEKIQNLESQISEKDTEIRRLKDELNKIENEHKKYIETFDSEVINLENENKELKAENNELKEKNQALSSNFSQKQDKEVGISLYIPCDEKELYPNEIYDFVKGIFYNAIIQETTAKGSRKEHVLDGIKKHINNWIFEKSNSGKNCKDCEIEWANAIRNKHSTEDIVSILEKHHFIGSKQSKHPKLAYYGDERYQTSIPNTPSDTRSHQNTITDTRKQCFLIPDRNKHAKS